MSGVPGFALSAASLTTGSPSLGHPTLISERVRRVCRRRCARCGRHCVKGARRRAARRAATNPLDRRRRWPVGALLVDE